MSATAKPVKQFLSDRGYRLFSVVVILLFFITMVTLGSLPWAYDTRDRLSDVYGAKSVQIISYKKTIVGRCGIYISAGSTTEWKYVQINEQIWAEEKSPQWRSVGDSSDAGRRWRDCMQSSDRSWEIEPIVVLILRAT